MPKNSKNNAEEKFVDNKSNIEVLSKSNVEDIKLKKKKKKIKFKKAAHDNTEPKNIK